MEPKETQFTDETRKEMCRLEQISVCFLPNLVGIHISRRVVCNFLTPTKGGWGHLCKPDEDMTMISPGSQRRRHNVESYDPSVPLSQ